MKMTLELAREGIWGTKDSPTPLTKQDLQEVVETFKDIKRVPVTLGHKLADFMPAFGWVTDLKYENNALIGKIELNELMSEAYEKKFYQNWSIGIRQRAKDGKKYLHHVAFLGEVPPKIKNLKIFDGKMVYADNIEEFWIKKYNKKEITGEDEMEEKQREIEELKKKIKEQEQLLSDFENKIKNEKKAKLMEIINGILPKEKHLLVEKFADIIPFKAELEFSEKDGKKKIEALDLLIEIFRNIPRPIEPDKFVFGEENIDNKRDISPIEIMDKI